MNNPYLSNYIRSLAFTILPTQKIIIVNAQSKFLYLSYSICADYGIIESEYKNKSYIDLPPISQIASSCISEDLECIQSGKVQQYITSQNHKNEIQLYLKQKTPLVIPGTNEPIGVRVDFFPIYSLGHFKPYINSHITNYKITVDQINERNNIKLTEIEELILFLLIMYTKPKIITVHLNSILDKDVSISTVRNIIHQQLLRKFGILNIENLIDKATFLGYDTILPRIMVKQFSIKIA